MLNWIIKTSLITSDPSWSALKFFKEPPYVPIGVLAALTITISVNLLFINFKLILSLKYTKNWYTINNIFINAPVAQLDRALGYGPGGSGFDS